MSLQGTAGQCSVTDGAQTAIGSEDAHPVVGPGVGSSVVGDGDGSFVGAGDGYCAAQCCT